MGFRPTLLRRMLWWRMLYWMLSAGLPITGFGQHRPTVLPIPGDPLELVTGPIETEATPESRQPVLELLARARQNFALKSGTTPYDLKVSFTADSGGRTNYDGQWEMEDVFVPGEGLHWTARTPAGYSTTRIQSPQRVYAEGTANVIPLRLQEARGLLIDPIQSPEYANRGSIRTSMATFHGAPVVCILLSHLRNPALPPTGRGWEESEECIAPDSALLQVHSEVPGRYAVYDYTGAPQLEGHTLPSHVTVTEAGRIVSRISVGGLVEMPAPDLSQFAPTDRMEAGGPGIAIKGAIRISRLNGHRSSNPATTLRAVCVFGVVTPTGQLEEAHSLQPSDPKSQEAVEDAEKINFSPVLAAGAPPQQHFAFIVEKFVSRQ